MMGEAEQTQRDKVVRTLRIIHRSDNDIAEYQSRIKQLEAQQTAALKALREIFGVKEMDDRAICSHALQWLGRWFLRAAPAKQEGFVLE